MPVPLSNIKQERQEENFISFPTFARNQGGMFLFFFFFFIYYFFILFFTSIVASIYLNDINPKKIYVKCSVVIYLSILSGCIHFTFHLDDIRVDNFHWKLCFYLKYITEFIEETSHEASISLLSQACLQTNLEQIICSCNFQSYVCNILLPLLFPYRYHALSHWGKFSRWTNFCRRWVISIEIKTTILSSWSKLPDTHSVVSGMWASVVRVFTYPFFIFLIILWYCVFNVFFITQYVK